MAESDFLYQTPNLTGGIDDALVDLSTSVPTFIPSLLLFIYLTILIGGMISQKKRSGFGDFPLWNVIGLLATTLVALPMTLVVGIIDTDYLAILVVLTIASGVLLFFTQSNREI